MTYVERKTLQSNLMSENWNKICKMASQGDLDKAYEKALQEIDDIYLLRLMLQTGPCLSRLKQPTARKILEKTNKISRGSIVNKLFIEWADDSYKIGTR